MFFILLTFSAALFIEALGSLVSVIGISALFGANPIIIALAISLDVGKIVVVSLLYTHWKQLSKLMKSYALVAAAVTMTITSAGAAGYLSGEFQKAIIGTKEGELKVGVLKEQQTKYQERKKQIDDQVAALPTKTTVNQRLRLMNGFKAEQQALDSKIAQIDTDLPEIQMKQIGTEAKAGPILYIAKAFDVSVEQAVKWVILMIIFVFDPLAIFLIIAGNFLWANHKKTVIVKPRGHEEEHLIHHTVEIEPAPRPLQDDIRESDFNTVSFNNETGKPIYPVMPKSFMHDEIARLPDDDNEPPTTVPIIETALPQEPEPLPSGGLLSPVNVDAIPTGAKLPREEITRSSLSAVPPDPRTIVDAGHNNGFRLSTRVITTPTKKLDL